METRSNSAGSLAVAAVITILLGCCAFADSATCGWRGAKVVFLGDSITDKCTENGCTSNYWNFMERDLGIVALAYGRCGARWGDMVGQAERLVKEHPSDIAAIFVFAGTNDFNGDVPLGNWYVTNSVVVNRGRKGDIMVKHRSFALDESTVRSGMNRCLKVIKDAYPGTPVYLMTPIHRGYATFGVNNVQPDESHSNGLGLFIDDYVAAVKEAGNVWAVNVIDLNAESGLFPLLRSHSQFFRNETSDMLHPNDKGHELIERAILRRLCAGGECMDSFAASFDLADANIEVFGNSRSVQMAADELRKHFAIISDGKATRRNPRGRFMIGVPPPGASKPESFTSYAQEKDGVVYFWGDDSHLEDRDRWGTLFAVYGFLEELLGVKWVEPGDRGIVFSPCETAVVPRGWSYRFFPPLEMTVMRVYKDGSGWLKGDNEAPRRLRTGEERAAELVREYTQWMLRLRHQTRRSIVYSHAFTDWNKRFLETHPEYLALDKDGVRGLPNAKDFETAKRVMLCMSNPAVTDQIIDDWLAAGAGEYLNACLNDSASFCHCEKCCAWDADLPDDPPKKHRTDRTLRFCNVLCEKARKVRPDVKVVFYIYSNYRLPPRRERVEYPENLLAGVVPSGEEDSEALIDGWRKAGLRHYFVRPNYLCYVGTAPRGLERFYVEDFKRNLAGGMVGIDEDNYPRAVTQFETYALGRIAAEPNLSFADIEKEWLSQYGAAAAIMGRYFERVRARGERARNAAVARNSSKSNGELAAALDDSLLFDTVHAAHTDEDFAGDLEVLSEAVNVEGLSKQERRRVQRMCLIVANARLTRRFLLARDNAPPDEFERLGRKLIEFRTANREIIDDNWGRVFRGYPAEVRWWRPLKMKLAAEFER